MLSCLCGKYSRLPFSLSQDSRLLGEVHTALLKLIIKDIEDVVRTPSGGPGTNQYSAINPEGGHPHIVEGVMTPCGKPYHSFIHLVFFYG